MEILSVWWSQRRRYAIALEEHGGLEVGGRTIWVGSGIESPGPPLTRLAPPSTRDEDFSFNLIVGALLPRATPAEKGDKRAGAFRSDEDLWDPVARNSPTPVRRLRT